MGRARKPGTPGKTTIPPEVVSRVTERLVAHFRKFGYDEEYHFFVVPQQCYLYLEVRRKREDDTGPPPPITKGSTTHKPLGRLKFLGGVRTWEHHPYLWSDEWWDERGGERGSPEYLLLGALVEHCL
jgi:hypothetical protein